VVREDVEPRPSQAGDGRLQRPGRFRRRGPSRISGRAAPLLAAAPLVCLAVAVPLLRSVPLNSDAVAQQSIVLTWLRVGHDQTFLPTDTWILKLPLYLVVESLPVTAATRVLIEVSALNILMFLLLAWASWWFAGRAGNSRRWYDVILPLAWLATVGGALGRDLSTGPNGRNVELALSFLVLAVAGAYVAASETGAGRGEGWRPWSIGVATAVLLSLLWVDDSYFAYLVGLPLLIVCLVASGLRHVARRGAEHERPRSGRLLGVAAVLAVSLLLVPVLRRLLAAVGVFVVAVDTTPSFSPATVLAHVRALGPSVTSQLGDRGAGGTVGLVFSLAIVLTGLTVSGYLAWRARRRRELVLTFLALQWLVALAAVILKRRFEGVVDGRYLVLVFVDLAVCAGVGLAAVRDRHPRVALAVTTLVVAAVTMNCTVRVLAGTANPPESSRQAETLRAASASGASKGFAAYWDANLYVHRSAGELQISEVVCQGNGRLQLRNFLTDTARLAVPARRTFLIYDAAGEFFKPCSLSSLQAQLGPPIMELPGASDAVVLVYGYDLATRLDPAPRSPLGAPRSLRGVTHE
jgi:hypothetical protein